MAIVRICHGQKELAVRLAQTSCSGGQLTSHEQVRMIISAPPCKGLLKTPWVLTGCWPGHPWAPGRSHPAPHQMDILVYPAFDTNDDGDIVFRFDNKLYNLPPGRYIGRIEFNNGMGITELDLDLCTIPMVIDRISQTSQSCV